VGPRCHRGPKIPVPSPLSTPEKASIPKLKYEALEISEVRGPFERKVDYSYLGPFKKKVAHIYIAVAVGPHLKAR